MRLSDCRGSGRRNSPPPSPSPSGEGSKMRDTPDVKGKKRVREG